MKTPARYLLVFGCVVLISCSSESPGLESGNSDTDTNTNTNTSTGMSCSDYESDQDIGPAVTISVRHEGDTPVYFLPVGCGGDLPISIQPEGGDPFGHRAGECFPVFCEQFLGSADCSPGCADCEGPPGGRIDPAALGDSSWTGVMHTPLEMTAACAPGSQCQTTCLRQDQAPAGTYELELTVYATCEGMCECDGDPANGICQIWQYQNELSDPSTFTATIDYPAQTNVELVIDL